MKNPLFALTKGIGYLFWPLLYIKKIKKDIFPIVKMINKLFTGSPMLLFLAFAYPVIFVSILGNVGSAHYVIVGVTSLVPMIIGVQVMPSAILNLKQSSILKRIGATSTKTSDITISFIFYFTIVSILSSIFVFGIGLSIYSSQVHFDLINFGQMFLSFLIGIVVALSVGVFVSGIVKSNELVMVIGLILTLPGAFLSGQFLSVALVSGWGPVKYISFIFPQKIATTFLHVVSNNHSIFDMSSTVGMDFDALAHINKVAKESVNLPPAQKAIMDQVIKTMIAKNQIVLVTKAELITSWILTPVEIIGFGVLASHTFKWGVRW